MVARDILRQQLPHALGGQSGRKQEKEFLRAQFLRRREDAQALYMLGVQQRYPGLLDRQLELERAVVAGDERVKLAGKSGVDRQQHAVGRNCLERVQDVRQ